MVAASYCGTGTGGTIGSFTPSVKAKVKVVAASYCGTGTGGTTNTIAEITGRFD